MITKNQLKQIASLKQKKYRDQYQQFVVEGDKLVFEAVESQIDVDYIIATEKWVSNNGDAMLSIDVVSEKEFELISGFKTPSGILAVCSVSMPILDESLLVDKLSLVLDDINDPGNLGTIVRTADWFGIRNVICSDNSVDVFNPKVVQSSMGAVFRVNVHYTNLEKFLNEYSDEKEFNIYGTYIEGGDSIYETELSNKGLIVMGSESHGISSSLKKYTNIPLSIPKISKNKASSESLNVAIATSIVCSEFRRRKL